MPKALSFVIPSKALKGPPAPRRLRELLRVVHQHNPQPMKPPANCMVRAWEVRAPQGRQATAGRAA